MNTPLKNNKAQPRRTALRNSPWLKPLTLLAGLIVLIPVLWALFPGLFTGQDPLDGGSTASLLPPDAQHWFGTDQVGRDVYARMVYGAGRSLLAAIIAVAVGLVIGTAIGVIAGTQRGWIEDVLMRIVDVLVSIPGILLSLSVVIILGFGTVNVALAVGITAIAQFARLARAQTLGIVRSDYVAAAYGSGANHTKVLIHHVLPNASGPLLALAVLQLGSAILQISTLSFLGYGTPPPTPEWGLIISEGRNFVATAWWLTVLPGIIVMAVVVATNRLGSVLREVGE
ncbi:ABC transporter permease [Brevibacterium sp. 50QC2O2]|jgi:peptide/nickel transport system permease protein|uniref:ABC transporter permease n=1 Tax=Brevibacterium TaxID=1696 RepID=UPI00211C7095|nr:MULTISPECIES: ABC transporter permease [unclassified Brevibacterium]MCQ9367725.1 ABC transporter permease [Brevibacterium sp. 91QC2O2]MCQ9384969.1 ABC transporter permease [Brevibacterium sp. 68QC2CO]MCQ9387984.1 ABC transporter permease [Brevibacterium sp. 50QC2O2]